MAGTSSRRLAEAFKALGLSSTSTRPSLPKRTPTSILARSMASVSTTPQIIVPERLPLWRPDAKVPLTIHTFPYLEPIFLEYYSVQHLHVPMRKDLLHRAVIYEGDKTRQGGAHVKNRWEVRGSHRKLWPQKGTGHARVGSRQTPIFRGGGKSFGPRKEKVFRTQLHKKVYDQAWRIALSYRYRRGELIVVEDGGLEFPVREDLQALVASGRMRPELQKSWWNRYVGEVLEAQGLGKKAGRTLFVAPERRETLWTGLNEHAGEHGLARLYHEVDVKDLLEKGKVVMEHSVLRHMLADHQADLVSRVPIHGWIHKGPPIGESAVDPWEEEEVFEGDDEVLPDPNPAAT